MRNILLKLAASIVTIAASAQSVTVSIDSIAKKQYKVWEPITFPILIKNNTDKDIGFTIGGKIHLPDGTDANRLNPEGEVPYSDGYKSFDAYQPWNPDDYPAIKRSQPDEIRLKANRKYYFVNGRYDYNIFPYEDGWRFDSPINFPLPPGVYEFDAVILTFNGERHFVHHEFTIVGTPEKLLKDYQTLESKTNKYSHELIIRDGAKCLENIHTITFSYLDTCKTNEIVTKAASCFSGLSCDYIKDLNELLSYLNKIEDKTALLVILKKIIQEISPKEAAFRNYSALNKSEYIRKVIKALRKRKDQSIAESFFGYVYEEEIYNNLRYPPEKYPELQKWILSIVQLEEFEKLLKAKYE